MTTNEIQPYLLTQRAKERERERERDLTVLDRRSDVDVVNLGFVEILVHAIEGSHDTFSDLLK